MVLGLAEPAKSAFLIEEISHRLAPHLQFSLQAATNGLKEQSTVFVPNFNGSLWTAHWPGEILCTDHLRALLNLLPCHDSNVQTLLSSGSWFPHTPYRSFVLEVTPLLASSDLDGGSSSLSLDVNVVVTAELDSITGSKVLPAAPSATGVDSTRCIPSFHSTLSFQNNSNLANILVERKFTASTGLGLRYSVTPPTYSLFHILINNIIYTVDAPHSFL